MIKIIAACDENNGIGFQGKLPWNYPEDLKHFKELTYGNTIIMGRKTMDNLPNKCLSNRLNLFLTHDVNEHMPKDNICGIEVWKEVSEYWPIDQHLLSLEPWPVYSVSHAIHFSNFFPDFSKIIYIIGGSQIFTLALQENRVDEVILTRVPGIHKCDTFFPIDLIKNWQRENVKKEGLSLEIYKKENEPKV